MKEKLWGMMSGLLILVGCGSNGRDSTSLAIPIYNQAYQEHYQADSIEEIVTQAEGAYVLVDPFGQGVVSKIQEIKLKNNQVGGYISAGTGENYREDFSALEPYLSSKAWEAWSDEFYVSRITPELIAIMKRRIDKMAEWGIDWVEFDNMDWVNDEVREVYQLEVTLSEAEAYINELCHYTHQKGMRCMAKNSVHGFDSFDGVLYESYAKEKNWWEVDGTKAFLIQNKLVIINHYNENNCDAVYEAYKRFYETESLSFICEDKALKKYRHYNTQ